MSRTRKQRWVSGPNGTIGSVTNFFVGTSPIKVTGTTAHAYCTDETHPGPPYRSGGPLSIDKLTIRQPLTRVVISEPSGSPNLYRTRMYASLPSYSAPAPTSLTTWGTRGWYRALPIHDVSGVARFIGELKDLPNSIRETWEFFKQFEGKQWRNLSPSFWANAYLNEQFGWAPFLGDLASYLDLGTRLDQALNRIIANNGKPIRRKFTMHTEDYYTDLGSTQTVSGGVNPVLDGHSYVGVSPKTIYSDRLHVKKRIFFDSKFRYYFTPEELNNDNFRAYLRVQLGGLIPDMNAIYQLIPWTWLLDWFTDTGTIVKNLVLSDKYRQVALYAYVMCEESYSVQRIASTVLKTGIFPSSNVSQIICTSEVIREYKNRVAATPYGFGLTWTDFNPFQLSIITALGLKRT